MNGGGPGNVGENVLQDREGTRVLSAICEAAVQSGDVLTIKTPGGGGYGD
jgi:5-oxoprolinase (ATP-hydrolysing)